MNKWDENTNRNISLLDLTRHKVDPLRFNERVDPPDPDRLPVSLGIRPPGQGNKRIVLGGRDAEHVFSDVLEAAQVA